MIDNINIGLAPIIDIKFLWAIGACLVAILAFALIKKTNIILWRALFIAALLVAGLNPSIIKTTATPEKDIAAILIDNSSSMKATNRIDGANLAASRIIERLKNYPNLELKTIRINDENSRTSISKSLDSVFENVPIGQIAGAIYIGDGQIDLTEINTKPYPIHQIIIGAQDEFDRWLEVLSAPVSANIGANAIYKIRVVQNGSLKSDTPKLAQLKIYVGNQEARETTIPTNKEVSIEVPIIARGKTAVAFEIVPIKGEISYANNARTTKITGIAEDMRVLLVTGGPYEGARAWRNLLKSDPNIDLVHFTILRGPENEDDLYQSDLSLIPFPTDELFFDHLDDFDLIVFDRFNRLDALPDYYMQRVAKWIENGGGFLVLAGPDEIQNNGIMATPLAPLMPVQGSATAINEPFRPNITNTGALHPITRDFLGAQSNWGKWSDAIKFEATSETLLSANGAPLLVVKSYGAGRIGIILSDKSWLWQRGYDGGGPFRALMARIIHWLLKNPELSTQNLALTRENENLLVTLSPIVSQNPQIKLYGPSQNSDISLDSVQNNSSAKTILGAQFGLYRAYYGDQSEAIVFGLLGETTHELIATNAPIKNTLKNGAGGKSIFIGIDGYGNLPNFAPSSPINLANPMVWELRQNNYKTKIGAQNFPLFAPWVYTFLLACILLLAWFYEGRAKR